MRPRKTGCAVVLGIYALLAARTPACAIGFHFSPANISIKARPGQVLNHVFTLTLAKDSPATHFRARLEDWWRSADNNQTFFAPPGTVKRSCGPWCTINPIEATCKPEETLTIKLTIRVPDKIEPGGYWSALTVEEVPDPLAPKPSGVSMVFRGSVSVGIFIEIPEATRAAKITGVRITAEKVAVTLQNDGNIPLKVNGTFEFYKPGENNPVAVVQIGGEPLLPEPLNICEFSAPLPNPSVLPSGTYKVKVIVDVGLDYLIGAEKELQIKRQANTDRG